MRRGVLLSRWARGGCFLLTAMAVVATFCTASILAPPAAIAQDNAPAAADDSIKTDEPPPKKQSENLLVWTVEALTLRYTIAFLAISFSFVALIVMIVMSFRREAICPSHLVESFEAHLNEKRYQEAYDVAKNDDSFLGRVLSAGLQRLSLGYDHAIEAMQEVGEDETMRLEHRLSYVAMIGSVSPMVGLLGTVDGMVQAFSVIATRNTTPKPAELAMGISTALVTTLVGLLLAIPAIIFLGFMKNRLARLTLEVGTVSENLMSRFETKK